MSEEKETPRGNIPEEETPVYAEGIKHARKMVHSNPNIVVMVALWDSGAITSCVYNPEKDSWC